MKYALYEMGVTEKEYFKILEKIKEIEQTEYEGYLGDQVGKYFNHCTHVTEIVLVNYYDFVSFKEATDNVRRNTKEMRSLGRTLEETKQAIGRALKSSVENMVSVKDFKYCVGVDYSNGKDKTFLQCDAYDLEIKPNMYVIIADGEKVYLKDIIKNLRLSWDHDSIDIVHGSRVDHYKIMYEEETK